MEKAGTMVLVYEPDGEGYSTTVGGQPKIIEDGISTALAICQNMIFAKIWAEENGYHNAGFVEVDLYEPLPDPDYSDGPCKLCGQ